MIARADMVRAIFRAARKIKDAAKRDEIAASDCLNWNDNGSCTGNGMAVC